MDKIKYIPVIIVMFVLCGIGKLIGKKCDYR